jgi:hypothetical protein
MVLLQVDAMGFAVFELEGDTGFGLTSPGYSPEQYLLLLRLDARNRPRGARIVFVEL